MINLFKIDPADNVAVSFQDNGKGSVVFCDKVNGFSVSDDIPAGHKIALEDISIGESINKYGVSIGHALKDIKKGDWVHVHNAKTNLSDEISYKYKPLETETESFKWKNPKELTAFRRFDGKVGIRNEIWVVPTVGCVNSLAKSIVTTFKREHETEGVDGVYSFSHPYGCSQLGDDHERTKKLLQNMVIHPNCGGVLVLGLGCENNQVKVFKETMPEPYDKERIRFLEVQSVDDEIEIGSGILSKLYGIAKNDKREAIAWKDLSIGLECGGSDAFSGITANPLIGRVSDYVISNGGTSVLTEVPEMFGAEHILMERCINEIVFNKTVDLINGFKEYYLSQNQPIYENPSPGNKSGGITTLEDKSMGCTRKAGSSKVIDVVPIDGRLEKAGLNLLSSPGNDIVATTSLGTAGCQIVLFSTGRGTPLGGFIPTLKIATNTTLAEKKKHWIDFDAGKMSLPGTDHDQVLSEMLGLLADIINGKETMAEKLDSRDIALFKTGITL